MPHKPKSLGFLSLLLLCSTSLLHAQFYSLETQNLRLIYYSKAHEYVVPHLARCFENALRFHQQLFDYTPTEKVTVLLEDFGDFGNGGATAMPQNFIKIGISPFSHAYETILANERMNWMMNHEMVHIVAQDKSSPADRFFQSLFFGKPLASSDNPISMFYSYLASPRGYSPSWYHEGIATFLETWMAGGLGRALGSYDEMVFRTKVRDGARIYDAVGLESEGTTIDFQVKANSYLYGTRFMTYLAYHYGPEKLLHWISRTKNSERYYSTQFKEIFNLTLDNEWANWISWEHRWQQANLDSIRQYPVTWDRPRSQQGLGSVAKAFYDGSRKKIYTAVNYPGQVAHLASIDPKDGTLEKLHEVKGAALYYVSSLAYDQTTGTLFYTTDNNKWRDVNAVNVGDGKSKRLIKDARTGDLTFNQADKSLWGVRHFNGITTLVRIPYPYKEWNQVHSFEYGKEIFDIDVSPDGSQITAALGEVNGNQKLIKMDAAKLLQGDASYEVLYDFENSTPANFVFSEDGKFLFGTSYYTGVSNVVRYDFENKKMEWLTNAETGYFKPTPISSDSLIVFRYTGEGFIPVMIANKTRDDVSAIRFLGQALVEKYPLVTTWKLAPPSPATINIDSLKTFSGTYRPHKDLKLISAYPIVEGYKDFPAYGLRFNFSDPIWLNRIDASASYTPNKILPAKERLHAAINYHSLSWRIFGTYNAADFYDLFGPTKKSRKGYSLGIQFNKFLVYDEPKLFDYGLGITYYGNLERLPDFQNIGTSFDRFLTASAKLNYQFFLKSLGAVDHEMGIRWQAVSHNNYVNGKLYSRVHSNFDYGIPLPINHSSIWLRSSAGYSFGERKEPFANFYFGGFGNNWVDDQEARRYREYYSFPGVELNNVSGTNYGKIVVEWTLPPIRFRRAGFLSLYSNWSQLTLFSSGIVTNVDSERDRRRLFNAGSQMDFKLVIFSRLESTFSLGYAVAVEEGRQTDEFMISLKLLK
jgi:hypothetical protein